MGFLNDQQYFFSKLVGQNWLNFWIHNLIGRSFSWQERSVRRHRHPHGVVRKGRGCPKGLPTLGDGDVVETR